MSFLRHTGRICILTRGSISLQIAQIEKASRGRILQRGTSGAKHVVGINSCSVNILVHSICNTLWRQGNVSAYQCFCTLSLVFTLGPFVPIEHSCNATGYMSIVADHVPHFMNTMYSSSDGYFQQDNAPHHQFISSQTGFPRSPSNRSCVVGGAGKGEPHYRCAANTTASDCVMLSSRHVTLQMNVLQHLVECI